MNWLRKRREELDLSQDELAAQLQVAGVVASRSAVSAWETERNKAPLDDVAFRQVLGRILRLSEPELLKRAGFVVMRTNRSEAAELAADLINDLPPDRQELAIRLIEQLRAS